MYNWCCMYFVFFCVIYVMFMFVDLCISLMSYAVFTSCLSPIYVLCLMFDLCSLYANVRYYVLCVVSFALLVSYVLVASYVWLMCYTYIFQFVVFMYFGVRLKVYHLVMSYACLIHLIMSVVCLMSFSCPSNVLSRDFAFYVSCML